MLYTVVAPEPMKQPTNTGKYIMLATVDWLCNHNKTKHNKAYFVGYIVQHSNIAAGWVQCQLPLYNVSV